MNEVLIVEDHPLVAEATADILKARKAQIAVTLAHNAADAIALLDSRQDWHRILLDLDVPGAFGLSLAREIAARAMAGRCCVVSALGRPDVIHEAQSIGMLGYIVKSMSVIEFALSLERILDGERVFPTDESFRRGGSSLLTRRQVQLLGLAGEGLSSKQISRVVGITEGSINNHFNAVIRALMVGNRAHAVARGIELGLISPSRQNQQTSKAGDPSSTSHSTGM